MERRKYIDYYEKDYNQNYRDVEDEQNDEEDSDRENIKENNYEEDETDSQCECDYCGIDNINEVVKCLECNRWFCNNKINTNMGSHIIIHLVKTKHREISVHQKSEHGESTLECYICSTKNIFQLGFNQVIQRDSEDNQESSNVIIICRNNCLLQQQYQNLTWSSDDFNPIVSEKIIANWIVRQSMPQTIKKARIVSTDIISQYEELKQKGQNVDIMSINNKNNNRKFMDVLLRYENGQQYCDIFQPLIRAEKEQDQRMKEQLAENNVKIKWEQIKNKTYAYFIFCQKEDLPNTIVTGNKMKISHKNIPKWEIKGTIISQTEEICLEIKNKLNSEVIAKNEGFKVELLSKPTSYLRMEKGVKRFERVHESITSHLYHKILGHNIAPIEFQVQFMKNMSAPNLPQLNVYQIEAVKKALTSPLCVIQGPPGTGKTVTSATIVYQLVELNKKKQQKDFQQILVCAPSNIVVDQLAEKINNTGVQVVRLCSRTRETVNSNIDFLTLHNQIKQLEVDDYSELQRIQGILDEGCEISNDEQRKYKQLQEKGTKEILEQAEVICCTCITASDNRLKNMIFQQVLIDEATQAIESECLLPMLHGAKQVVLVGDHRQLGPVVNCKETARAGLNRSLFERLVSLGIRPIRLQVQYRMHPELSVFPSNTFYEGTLQNGVTITDRSTPVQVFAWPNQTKPMFFYNIVGTEEMSQSGTSYINRTEGQQIEKIVHQFLKNNVKPTQLGIITPYKGQMAYIINLLQNSNLVQSKSAKEIEVVSVDGFQGREKDYILISCVRSNDGLGIGFLTDPRRLNVTLTRAKYGLIICGNAKVLSRDNLWNNLLNHFNDNGLLVEGSLQNLKQTNLKFRPSQKYIPDRKNLVQYDDDNMSTNSYLRNQYQHQKQVQGEKFSMGYRDSQFGFQQLKDLDPYKEIYNEDDQNNNNNNNESMKGMGQFFIDDEHLNI